MRCKYVIHAVGPIWSHVSKMFDNICFQGRQDDVGLLRSAVYSTLKLACDLKCESVSIPAISSGIFGFPKPLCAEVMFNTIEEFAKDIQE